MNQTKALHSALKKQLKHANKTYADLALALNLSEASVKRLFAENSFSILRLETACQFLGIELSELVAQMQKSQPRLQHLTEQQEAEIASDIRLLLVAVCVVNGYTFQEILDQYHIKETECIQKLILLDRLKIIELLTNNRIKLLIAPSFRWRKNGPIQRFFMTHIKQEFFESSFTKSNEKLIVLNALLSKSSIEELIKGMEKLENLYVDLQQKDTALPMHEKHGTTLLTAMRQWQTSLFKQLLR